MYIPSSFRETDLARLHAFLEQNSFATLVAQHDDSLVATHLPLLLDRGSTPQGHLVGHVARANPQGQEIEGKVLAIFTGPHAYVSPSWYEADDVVPTWNYIAVHVYGTARRIENEEAVLQLLRRTVAVYERTMPRPWQLNGSPEFLHKMVAGITAFQIEIERIEGKWKLSQNQPEERQQRVMRALQGQADENAQAVAALMSAALAPLKKGSGAERHPQAE